jgi:hypothetical protein
MQQPSCGVLEHVALIASACSHSTGFPRASGPIIATNETKPVPTWMTLRPYRTALEAAVNLWPTPTAGYGQKLRSPCQQLRSESRGHARTLICSKPWDLRHIAAR